MDDFWNDVRELAASPVSSQAEAQSVFDLFSELISQEIFALDPDACQRSCSAMVSSKAYQSDLQRSHELLECRLLTTDPLQKHEVEFVATVILNDPDFMQTLGQSTDAVNAVINCIWMFRFTQPRIVQKYMLILVAACIATQLDASVLQNTITNVFVLFLFRTVCNNDELLRRPSLLVLLALNHQYMLQDMHGPANKVFWELEQTPQQYTDIGSSLVMRLNRSHDSDEALKVITCKFFYLLFTNNQTADLLYTNDLNVLLGVVIRELNDLPTECVQTREMYLRVLYAMLVHSPLELTSPYLRSTIVQTLRLIMERVLELDDKEDQVEMMRLAERCLAVKWLEWSNDGIPDDDSQDDGSDGSLSRSSSFADDVEFHHSNALAQSASAPSSPSYSPVFPHRETSPSIPPVHLPPASTPPPTASTTSASTISHRRPPPPPPPPPKPSAPLNSRTPPPPPPPRHMSVASYNSEDSQMSLDLVDQLRPPPAPPSRKLLLRLEKTRSN